MMVAGRRSDGGARIIGGRSSDFRAVGALTRLVVWWVIFSLLFAPKAPTSRKTSALHIFLL